MAEMKLLNCTSINGRKESCNVLKELFKDITGLIEAVCQNKNDKGIAVNNSVDMPYTNYVQPV